MTEIIEIAGKKITREEFKQIAKDIVIPAFVKAFDYCAKTKCSECEFLGIECNGSMKLLVNYFRL